VDTYPQLLRPSIEELHQWLGPAVNRGIWRAVWSPQASTELVAAFRQLNRRLSGRRYLLGNAVTDADVRLWVSLVRYDVGPNAHGRAGPPLHHFPELWGYARDLYTLPAFSQTTDFASFRTPMAAMADWQAPTDRDQTASPAAVIEPLGGWSLTPTRSASRYASGQQHRAS
jgi:putative glutathione S-transferase